MSWVTGIGNILTGQLPGRPKIPGQGDDMSTFGSDTNGFTGQGPMVDGSGPSDVPLQPMNRISSLPPSVNPQQSAPPPQAQNMGTDADSTSASDTTAGNQFKIPAPLNNTPQGQPSTGSTAPVQPMPSALPPPPTMAPPQPMNASGADESQLPPSPQVQAAMGPSLQPGQGDGLPPKPGSTQPLSFPFVSNPQLVPRSQAQFNAGMGQNGPQSQQPGQPLQGTPADMVAQTIANNALHPSPLPKPPSGWRTGLSIAAGTIGGPALQELAAYGPRGVAQINAHNQQTAQQGQLEKAAGVLDAKQKNDIAATQAQEVAAERKRNDDLTAYTAQTNNLRTNHYRQLVADEKIPDGYTPVTVKSGPAGPETWIGPTAEQLKKEQLEAANINKLPVGKVLSAALGGSLPAAQMISPELYGVLTKGMWDAEKEKNPTEASIAWEASGHNAAKAMALLKPQDGQAAENRALTGLLLQERLKKMQEDNQPIDLDSAAHTTLSGRKYIVPTDVPGKSLDQVKRDALKAGVPVVDKSTADALSEIDTAKSNMDFMAGQLLNKLPKDAAGRVTTGLNNKLSQYLQTDSVLAAAGTYRSAAIQLTRAVAGSKGIRINRDMIQASVDNDIPTITDTVGAAQQKLDNMKKFLADSEAALLDRDRSAGASAAPKTNPNPNAYVKGQVYGGLTYLGGDAAQASSWKK